MGKYNYMNLNQKMIRIRKKVPKLIRKRYSEDVTYDFVKNNAKDTKKASFLFYGNHDYKYEPEEKDIKVKYIFQNLYDHEKYENPNGEKEPLIKEYKAKTGDKFKIPGLNKEIVIKVIPKKIAE